MNLKGYLLTKSPSYQKKGGLVVPSRVLDVCERRAPKGTAGSVQSVGQSQVVLTIYQKAQVGTEHSPRHSLHLEPSEKT